MRHHFPLKKRMRSLCAELGEDDGLDPHLWSRRIGRAGQARGNGSAAPLHGRPVDRKASQLCRQVALTLDEVLPDCGDGVLQALRVVEVAPFPDASRLLVTVASVDGKTEREYGLETVLEHLRHASGHLRCEVAAAVTRKRAPLLVYHLANPPGMGAVPGTGPRDRTEAVE
jgi:ribosome-binding factor A